jgi:hypothetical protein
MGARESTEAGVSVTKVNEARDRVVDAARAFCEAARIMQSLEDMPSGKVHELYDAMRELEKAEGVICEMARFDKWWREVGITHMPKGDRPPEHAAIAELAWMAAKSGA